MAHKRTADHHFGPGRGMERLSADARQRWSCVKRRPGCCGLCCEVMRDFAGHASRRPKYKALEDSRKLNTEAFCVSLMSSLTRSCKHHSWHQTVSYEISRVCHVGATEGRLFVQLECSWWQVCEERVGPECFFPNCVAPVRHL